MLRLNFCGYSRLIKKIALITGVTGQDGALLARFLLEKGYEVHGIRRRTSVPVTERIEDLVNIPQEIGNNFYLHYGDLTDGQSLTRLIHNIQPTEIYNLGAQSHVHVSFDSPEYTANVNALGALRILESIRNLDMVDSVRYYQASTSELYGKIQAPQQDETTPFYPRSPYAVSKLFAYWTTINYREAYGMFACNGILFNHESASRGMSFVTRKITSGLARLVYGEQKILYLGNLDAQRDWGHAKDYVEMQWLMLQQDKPEDYVIASGIKHSVREFVALACEEIGFGIKWKGIGVDEVGYVSNIDEKKFAKSTIYSDFSLKVGEAVIKIDPYYFRPTEVDVLWGNAHKACKELNWKPKIQFEDLVAEMVQNDLHIARKQAVLNQHV